MILCLSTGCEKSQYDAVLRRGMIYLRIGAGQTLVAHTRRSIPWRLRANPERQLLGGGEGEGRGPTIETDLHFVLDRVGRWSLDDVE
jgi:hypothetical protein